MIPWYAPTNIKVWRRRLVSPRSVVLILVMLTMVMTELRFDWIEKAVGAYLVTTNVYRPKSGTIWEKGLKVDSARQQLTQYADQRENMQREVRKAESLAQVIATLEEGKGAMISADHFLSLYTQLPPVLSHEIVSPYTLLTLASDGRWQRTFLERQDNQVQVYMLDGQSQVIHRLGIGSVLLGYIERGEVAVRAGLDQLSDFTGHIYEAGQFFSALDGLPTQIREKVVPQPEALLRISGRIRRVGISDTILGDTVDVGFEVQDADGLKVILVQGMADDVRHLQKKLEDRSFSGWPWSGERRP